MSTQIIQTMREAAHEIRSLRREAELLRAQVSVVNVFAAALGMKADSDCASIDVAWKLEKLAEEEQKKFVEVQLSRASEQSAENIQVPE